MPTLEELIQCGLSPSQIGQQALQDETLLRALFAGIAPQKQKKEVRETCSQALLFLSQQHPQILLPYWEQFTALLPCGNGFSQYVAVHALANLSAADQGARMQADLGALLVLLDSPSVMVAGHTAAAAGQVAAACPSLQAIITERLLKASAPERDAERAALIVSYVLDAFDLYIEGCPQRERMVGLAFSQIDCASPKTRKRAKQFLDRWG